jgi:integrase
LVFTNRNGKLLDSRNLHDEWKGLIEDAGLPEIRFHDLRHTHATLLLMANVHPKVVQERLGHSSINITLDTYSHTIPSMQSEAMKHLDDLVRG